MFKNSILAIYVIAVFLVSCRSSKIAVTTVQPSGSTSDYIEKYKDIAVSEMKRAGVPASITLAQGMIESGNGKSRLAIEANNHFGIKCHDDWEGATIRYNDDRRNECFRKYRTADESFRDHSDFLRSTPRYSSLFDLEITDYKGWARGLKKAGYATNPDYAEMLIRKIEEYNLNSYDNPKAMAVKSNGNIAAPGVKNSPADTVKPAATENVSVIAAPATAVSEPYRVKENNRIQYIIVNERDTRSTIEKDNKLLRWELAKYNDLDPDFTPVPGQILYLQPKRERAEPGKEYHILQEGETIYSVSQIYGIKLKSLYLMNRLEPGTEPAAGQKLWLRDVKPAGLK
jgi:hypothetical protein